MAIASPEPFKKYIYGIAMHYMYVCVYVCTLVVNGWHDQGTLQSIIISKLANSKYHSYR